MKASELIAGARFESNNYGGYEVVERVDAHNTTVRFVDTGYVTTLANSNLWGGRVKDPLVVSVAGVGYLGEPTGCVLPAVYGVWASMLSRCYKPSDKGYHIYGGRGVTVDTRWHNYANFFTWYVWQSNYGTPKLQLDKDILGDGTLYSEDTCSLVPRVLNNQLTTQPKTISTGLPIGVWGQGSKFYGSCKSSWKTYHSKAMPTVALAFARYKEKKEAYIKEVAKEAYLKGEIIEKVYEALLAYQVDPYPKGHLKHGSILE